MKYTDSDITVYESLSRYTKFSFVHSYLPNTGIWGSSFQYINCAIHFLYWVSKILYLSSLHVSTHRLLHDNLIDNIRETLDRSFYSPNYFQLFFHLFSYSDRMRRACDEHILRLFHIPDVPKQECNTGVVATYSLETEKIKKNINFFYFCHNKRQKPFFVGLLFSFALCKN